MTCLFGATWAWYSSSVTTGSNKISTATFDLDITVTEKDTENKVEKDEDGYFALEPTKTYTVSLAKNGSAKTGFCHISIITQGAQSATAYYTDSIPQINETTKEEISPFVFTLYGVERIKFTAMWGTPPADQADKTVKHNTPITFDVVSAAPAPTTTESSETKGKFSLIPSTDKQEQTTQESKPQNETATIPESKQDNTANTKQNTSSAKTEQ